MPLATVRALRGRTGPARLSLLTATAALAWSVAALAAADESGQVIRAGSSELRFVVPYREGRVPVVLVHGLLGSPGHWSVVLEQLSVDPVVRARCQFLTFRYDSLQPIPDSGLALAEALDEARRRFDPQGRDRAFDRVVLVGHSLGGLVAKAAGQLRRPLAARVARAVFIATPHRGSPANRGPLRAAGRWLARGVGHPPSGDGGPPVTSLDQLAWDHPLLGEIEQARAAEPLPSHTIIAALRDPTAADATDGLVPVASARLAGVISELVVRSHHLCLQHPEVVREIRRILIEHAAAPAQQDEPSRTAPLPRQLAAFAAAGS